MATGEKKKRCGPKHLPPGTPGSGPPRSRPRGPRGLTSIQEHQGSQHQERSCLPHKLVQHTPKGGAHCREEREGPVPGPGLMTTPWSRTILRFLRFSLYFVPNTVWGGHPTFCSGLLSCPGNFLQVVSHLRHGITPKVKVRGNKTQATEVHRKMDQLLPWSIHGHYTAAQTGTVGSQMKARNVTEKGEDLDLSGKVFAPGLGAQPGQVEEAGSESGKVLRWDGNSENVQEEGPWQAILFKTWVYIWARERGLGSPGPPSQDSSHHFSKSP